MTPLVEVGTDEVFTVTFHGALAKALADWAAFLRLDVLPMPDTGEDKEEIEGYYEFLCVPSQELMNEVWQGSKKPIDNT